MGKKNLHKDTGVSALDAQAELEAAEFQKELLALKGIQQAQTKKNKNKTKKPQHVEKHKGAEKGKAKELQVVEAKDEVDVEGTGDEAAATSHADHVAHSGDDDEDGDESEDEEEEDGQQVQATSRNQRQEMLEKIKELHPVKVPWIERLDVSSAKPVVVENIDDDFKRELAL